MIDVVTPLGILQSLEIVIVLVEIEDIRKEIISDLKIIDAAEIMIVDQMLTNIVVQFRILILEEILAITEVLHQIVIMIKTILLEEAISIEKEKKDHAMVIAEGAIEVVILQIVLVKISVIHIVMIDLVKNTL